jgi:hypothetical protein
LPNRQIQREYGPENRLESVKITHRNRSLPDTIISFNLWGGLSSFEVSFPDGRTYFTSWWATGGKWRQYSTLEGKEDGPAYEFHSNGMLKSLQHFKNGLPTGETCSWDMFGEELHYGTFGAKGLPCGKEYFYKYGKLDTVVIHPQACDTSLVEGN